MMILTIFRIGAAGALLGGLAAPAAAADSEPRQAQSSSAESERPFELRRSNLSRRVELPFPLEYRSPGQATPRPVPRVETPHPYRNLDLDRTQRAAFESGTFGGARLSRALALG